MDVFAGSMYSERQMLSLLLFIESRRRQCGSHFLLGYDLIDNRTLQTNYRVSATLSKKSFDFSPKYKKKCAICVNFTETTNAKIKYLVAAVSPFGL